MHAVSVSHTVLAEQRFATCESPDGKLQTMTTTESTTTAAALLDIRMVIVGPITIVIIIDRPSGSEYHIVQGTFKEKSSRYT